jgi:hypothetical protein
MCILTRLSRSELQILRFQPQPKSLLESSLLSTRGNQTIDGNQMTICFHVDDCKLSHRDPKVMDDMIGWLRKEYERVFEDGSGQMTVSRGKVHKYLRLTQDYTIRCQVKISMLEFVDEIWQLTTKWIRNREKQKLVLHQRIYSRKARTVRSWPKISRRYSLILWQKQHARPDTCTFIAFLTTRMRAPDMEIVTPDEVFEGTRKLPLILSANGNGILKWRVDASFAVHPILRGHSGGGLSLGRGFPISCSTKQKINTRSSTESELVGADNFMPAICWTRYFLVAQGYHVQDNILLQDKKSAILLEKNVRASSGRRTKHINIRYFFNP